MSWKTIRATLGLDATGFETGVKRAESSLDRLGRNAGGMLRGKLAAAFSLAAIGSFISHVVEAADRVKDMADVFGVTTDEVQKLDIAAKRNAKSFEDVGKAMDKMGANRLEAVQTNDKLLHAFNRLGISAKVLADENVRNLDILKQIAEVANSGSDQQRADAMGIMGKGGAQLLATLNEFRTLGPIPLFRKEDLEAIEKLKDTWGLMTHGMTVGASRMFGAVTGSKSIQQDFLIREQMNPIMRMAGNMTGLMPAMIGLNKMFNTQAAQKAKALIGGTGGPVNPFNITSLIPGAEQPGIGLEASQATQGKAFDAALRTVDNLFKKLEPPHIERLQIDQLQKVGGIVGMAGMIDPAMSVQLRQVDLLTQIDAALDKLISIQPGKGQLPAENAEFQ